ncbi:PIN domain-containing protein [Patescibacteria group bacterium]|nr:PIN domain-containing protein [Patescibacteria group bacterium]
MIFVDTSAWVSLVDKNDDFHDRAVEWFKNQKDKGFVISNLVIIETLGWIRYKLGKRQAIKVGEKLFGSEELRIEKVTREDEQKAWKLFQKLDGRGVSMIDCTCFALMRRLKIKEAFTFDKDFKKIGFTVYPDVKVK